MTDSVDVIKKLLTHSNAACPFSGIDIHIDIQEIIKLIQLNKCTHVLFHFIECRECRKKLDEKEISRLIQLKLLTDYRQRFLLKERENLIKFSKLNNLRVIFYKNNPYQTRKNMQKISADIDVLVTLEDQKKLSIFYTQQGYTQKAYPPKEISIFNKTTHLSIDLHTLIAYPHYGDMRKNRLLAIQELSVEINKNVHKNKKTSELELNKPYYLVFLSLYFWYNDLGFGLSTIYTFFDALKNSTVSELHQAETIVKQNNIYSLFSFIAVLAYRFFDTEIPEKISSRFRLKNRQKALIRLFLKDFIVSKHTIIDWHSGDSAIREIYLKYYITDLILDDTIPLSRFIRFRVFDLYIRTLFFKFDKISM